MSHALRPILPAPSGGSGSQRQRAHRPSAGREVAVKSKRVAIPAACDSCRHRKIKCDGQRPSCQRCLSLSTPCIYQRAEGESIRLATKRKLQRLEDENAQYRELFTFIQTRSAEEAREICSRIRTSSHPKEVFRSLKDAELLLPRPMVSSSIQVDQRILRLDQEALVSAPIKVPARPWTTVAGDGIVSELITDFFAHDHLYFYPPIDRDSFLEDMRKTDMERVKYCSPLLVNAICAHRCTWSRRVKSMGAIFHQDMSEQFMQESKKLLDNECGRASLPTVLALYYMYATLTFQGRDRAGNLFRYMTIDMLKRLNLARRFSRLRDEDAGSAQERRVISRALWGLFIFESRICSMYRHQSFIHPPTIPRLFDVSGRGDLTIQQNIHILGQPFQHEMLYLPQTPGILHAVSDLSELFYEVTTHNCKQPEAEHEEQDVLLRTNLYSKWKAWKKGLPDMFRCDKNFTPQTCWLNSHANEVATSILIPLDPATVLASEVLSVKQLSLQHCHDEIELAGRFVKQWPADGLLGRGQFITLSILVPFLQDSSIHDLFTVASQLLRLTLSNFPVIKIFLQGIRALAWNLKQEIPLAARPSYEGLQNNDDIRDLPTSFVLPKLRDLQAMMEDDEDHPGHTRDEISTLISKWSALTVDV